MKLLMYFKRKTEMDSINIFPNNCTSFFAYLTYLRVLLDTFLSTPWLQSYPNEMKGNFATNITGVRGLATQCNESQ